MEVISAGKLREIQSVNLNEEFTEIMGELLNTASNTKYTRISVDSLSDENRDLLKAIGYKIDVENIPHSNEKYYTISWAL